MPLPSPVPGRKMSTRWRKRPRGWPIKRLVTYWRSRWYHTGADWSAPKGAPVLALNSGWMIPLDDDVLGDVVLLFWQSDHSGYKYTSWYCHLDKRFVSHFGQLDRETKPLRLDTGNTVTAYAILEGEQIGTVGDSGSGAMGPHLHLEKRSGWTTSWSGSDLDPMKSWGR